MRPHVSIILIVLNLAVIAINLAHLAMTMSR